jgi:tRNA(Ile2) C34 agmatinyltransferase TiaS
MNLDPLADAADPNCPRCLERMQLVVGGWWCDGCRVVIRPV